MENKVYRGTITFPPEDKSKVKRCGAKLGEQLHVEPGCVTYETTIDKIGLSMLDPYWGRWVWSLGKIK